MVRIICLLILPLFSMSVYAKQIDCGNPPAERFQALLNKIQPMVEDLAKENDKDSWPVKIDKLRSKILEQNPTLSTEYLDPVYSYLICDLVKQDKNLKTDKDKEDKLLNCCDFKEYSQRDIES